MSKFHSAFLQSKRDTRRAEAGDHRSSHETGGKDLPGARNNYRVVRREISPRTAHRRRESPQAIDVLGVDL